MEFLLHKALQPFANRPVSSQNAHNGPADLNARIPSTVIQSLDRHTMIFKIIGIACVIVLTACDNRTDTPQEAQPEPASGVDSCDLRALFGTCVEYTLSELDEWYSEYVVTACPRNRRHQLVGKYQKDTPCPLQGRVARCEGIVEQPGERYEYDKHYYGNTAEGYPWDAANIQVTCNKVSGRYVPE